MKRVVLSWSSGKDCAWTLHLLRQTPGLEVVALLTTVNAEFDRVAMHGTRRSVLEAQAEAAGLPLRAIPLPWPCSNEIYEERMKSACDRAIAEHVDAIAFGDLFLSRCAFVRLSALPSGAARHLDILYVECYIGRAGNTRPYPCLNSGVSPSTSQGFLRSTTSASAPARAR